MPNETITYIAIIGCFIVELPKSRKDCVTNPDGEIHCVACRSIGQFFTGGGLTEYSSAGHVITVIIGMLTVVFGICGAFMSVVIIKVLRRQNTGKSFEILLTSLAISDIVCGIGNALCGVYMTTVLQNWSRSQVTMNLYMIFIHIGLLGRSASCFITVLIAIERYVAIAFPDRFLFWFTPVKSKILVGCTIFLSIFPIIPRVMSWQIGANEHRDIESVKDHEYFVLETPSAKFWYELLQGYPTKVEFWLPLPLLLIFNGLIYYHIRKFASRRKELNLNLRRDLRASKMFLPVVGVLLICYIGPLFYTFYSYRDKISYLEPLMLMFLAATVNSATNLPIYYVKAPGFRQEAKIVLRTWFPFLVLPRLEKDRNQVKDMLQSSGDGLEMSSKPTACSDIEDRYN